MFGISAVASIALEREDVTQSTLDSDVERLVVRGDASDVTVVPSTDQRIHVRAEARYVTERPSPNPQVEDGVLRLDGDCGDWWLLGGCSIDYRVAVPAGMSVDVETAAGDVSVRGLDARDVRIASDAGDVHVKLYGVPDSVDVTSDAGDVHVEVPRAAYAVRDEHGRGRRGRRRHRAGRGRVEHDPRQHRRRRHPHRADPLLGGYFFPFLAFLRGDRFAKSSAISSNVAQRTPGCDEMWSIRRSCIISTCGRPLTSGWIVNVKTA